MANKTEDARSKWWPAGTSGGITGAVVVGEVNGVDDRTFQLIFEGLALSHTERLYLRLLC